MNNRLLALIFYMNVSNNEQINVNKMFINDCISFKTLKVESLIEKLNK